MASATAHLAQSVDQLMRHPHAPSCRGCTGWRWSCGAARPWAWARPWSGSCWSSWRTATWRYGSGSRARLYRAAVVRKGGGRVAVSALARTRKESDALRTPCCRRGPALLDSVQYFRYQGMRPAQLALLSGTSPSRIGPCTEFNVSSSTGLHLIGWRARVGRSTS